MRYREIKPVGFLGNFIQCFWQYENTETEITHTILPDGHFDLIAEFKDDVLVNLKLTGVWTKPVNVVIPKLTRIFAVRFKLLAAEYLFQQEIKSILDTTKPLPFDYWDIKNYEKCEFENFVSEFTRNLENSIKRLNEIDNRKLKLFEIVYRNKQILVKEISENVSWNSRQINRYFNAKFGFSLKEFIKIVRFQSSFSHISNGKMYPETNDYFDQAHFIKEVKRYSGTTPKVLSGNKNDRFLQLSKVGRV